MAIYIERNNSSFGPYDINLVLQYVNDGKILLHDRARDSQTNYTATVSTFLKQAGLKPKIGNRGNLGEQLKRIGSELILPVSLFRKKQWLSDKRFLLLALIGLCPSLLMTLPISGFMVFYLVALYFSTIWGLFFYYFFSTKQVAVKTVFAVFFLTQAVVFLIWDVMGLPNLNPFYMLVGSSFPVKMLGYVFGVGLTEEFFKMLPLLIIYRFALEPLQPKTLLFYGLMSGIAFGVYEGVQYQMSVNVNYDYDVSFFLNIARLTSLPFLHATWTGIAGYFVGFAKLYPLYRRSLYFLAIAVPSVLHGLYDTFCGYSFGIYIALAITFFRVFLLMTYLRQAQDYQSKLM